MLLPEEEKTQSPERKMTLYAAKMKKHFSAELQPGNNLDKMCV